MRQFLLIIFLSTLFLSCNSNPVKDIELHNLVALLIGEFSNEEQAENDSSFAHLNLINIRIWKDKPGYWVYSEVSDAKGDHHVYNQMILNYERLDSSTIKSTSYKIISVKDHSADLNNPEFSGRPSTKLFDRLTLDSLEIKTGCQVYFKKKTSTIYSGKTGKGSCNNNIDYIDYIMSTYVVSKDKISIWTKGYNNNGKQVWGKIKGPYKYKRTGK
ncbi:chromophore lyase CpcT/CpeT [Aquimarina sp. AU58]|uniref:chromophore lyase CpcT/CpeT n=1 Tax=Aquimarina sp. AU58 TaxID=1874112 RepID=UPI000D65D674|nr:chromophore lyase CpcT/CpeT [Aquimarina sp. AU58]